MEKEESYENDTEQYTIFPIWPVSKLIKILIFGAYIKVK
jgi:hypothetical protein